LLNTTKSIKIGYKKYKNINRHTIVQNKPVSIWTVIRCFIKIQIKSEGWLRWNGRSDLHDQSRSTKYTGCEWFSIN